MTQVDIVLDILRNNTATSGEIEDASMRLYHTRIRGVTQRISEIRQRGGVIEVVRDGHLNRFQLVREPEPRQAALKLRDPEAA